MTWRDPKRGYWLLGLVVPTLPLLAWAHVRATGQGIFWWLGPLVVFGLVPFVDHAIGKDASNPPEAAVGRLEADRYYRWCVYLFLPLQFASLVFACWIWTYGGLATAEKLGLALTVAMVAGISINTAHELGHKHSAHEKWLSKLALAQTGYGPTTPAELARRSRCGSAGRTAGSAGRRAQRAGRHSRPGRCTRRCP